MTLGHWDDADAPWDKLRLGIHSMPGVWEITSGECARQVDHKKTKNKDGARIKDLGLLPPRFSAKGRMCSHGDWLLLQQVMPDIHPKKKGGIKFPLAIFHPAVALLGVTQIYVERVRAPEVKDGILEIQIDMIEWTAEPKETKTTNKTSAPSGYIGTDESMAILAAQQSNWGLRRAGLGNTSVGGSLEGDELNLKFDSATDEEFAKLTGDDTRNPPSATTIASIDPSTSPI